MEEYKEGINIKNLKIPAVKGDRGISVKDINIAENGDLIIFLDDGTQNNAGNINKIERASLIDGQLIIETTGGEIHNAGNVYDDEFIQARIDKFNTSVDEKIIEFNNNVTIHNREFNALFDESKANLLEISEQEKEEISQHTERIYQRIDNLDKDVSEELEKTGNKLELLLDSNTYIMTLNLLDRNNKVLSSKQVDLPLETMVINANYIKESKEIELTLKNGEKVSFSVADLVSGLVSNEQLETALNDIKSEIDLSIEYNTFSGASANIQNSAEAYMKSFNIEGVIEQEVGQSYNLLNITKINGSQTYGGITATIMEDGLLLNGTATSTAIFELTQKIEYPAGDYRLSGCPAGGAINTYRMDMSIDNAVQNMLDIGSGVNFSLPQKSNIIPRIRVQAGTTVENLLFKPMIIEDTEEKTYIPYRVTPSLKNPSEILGLHGDISVKVSNDVEEQNYILNFGDLTLYKDEIPYIEGDKVYYDKKWNKYTFIGDEKIELQTISTHHRILVLTKDNTNMPIPISVDTNKIEDVFCNITKKGSANNTWDGIPSISYRMSDSTGFTICLENLTTEQEYRDALKGNYIVYQLATPVKTEITGELANQIKNLYKNIQTYEGSTDIELLGYGQMKGEYLINTELANKLSEINDITNIGLTKKIDEVEQKIENSGLSIDIDTIKELISNSILEDNEKKYPIGKLEFNTSGENPINYLGFGEWIQWGSGRVPVGFDASDTDFNSYEKTGGQKTYQLTTNELPSHTHVYYRVTAIDGTTLSVRQLPEHFHNYMEASDVTDSTTLTAAQSGLPKHSHKLIKGYYTYNADSTSSVNTNGKGLQFLETSQTGTTEVGGANATQGHTHVITRDDGVTSNGADTHYGYKNEECEGQPHTHEILANSENTELTGLGEAFDIMQPYIVCYMWKRTA